MPKYWIDKELGLRANENGWPEYPPKPGPMSHQEFFREFYEDDLPEYYKAIEKAKAESVEVFESNGSIFKYTIGKPDSFIDLPVEVDFVRQFFLNECWTDDFTGRNFKFPKCLERTIARLKHPSADNRK